MLRVAWMLSSIKAECTSSSMEGEPVVPGVATDAAVSERGRRRLSAAVSSSSSSSPHASIGGIDAFGGPAAAAAAEEMGAFEIAEDAPCADMEAAWLCCSKSAAARSFAVAARLISAAAAASFGADAAATEGDSNGMARV